MQIVSLAVNGISYMTSGKSAADHGISAVVQKDCSMIRLVRAESVCNERTTSPTGTAADTSMTALSPIQAGSVVEVSRPARVIAPQGLFADRRRPLIQVVATGDLPP